MSRQLFRTRQNALIYLLLPLTIGLSGFILLRKRKSLPSLFNYWDKSKYKALKKFIIAQSKVETGGYSSGLFLRANNAFGMKNALYRDQYGYKVQGDPYRNYANVLDSIKDFELYLDSVGFPVTVNSAEAYTGNLKRLNYFESPLNDYTKALKSWL